MRTDPRVSAVAATGVMGLIGQCGGNPAKIFGAASLDVRELGDPAASINLRSYCDLFEHAAQQTGVGSFGLRFGVQYRLEDMGPLGLLLINSPTLGDALKSLCRYFPAIQENSTMCLRADGDLMALQYQIRDGRIAQRRQDAELTIGMFAQLFQRCLGPSWGPEEVHFEHLRGGDLSEIRALLGAPVYFAAPMNAILFRRAALAAPMPEAELRLLPALHAQLQTRAAAARPDDFIGQVVSQIRTGLAEGDASIELISARLGFSRTGLYRRLGAEGVDFSALTQRVRQDLALMYVAQPGIAFTEIAPLLGYSELSAFSRAFTRWTGLSPARYRQQRQYPC